MPTPKIEDLDLTEKLMLIPVWDNLFDHYLTYLINPNLCTFGEYMVKHHLPEFCGPWGYLTKEPDNSKAYQLIFNYLERHEIHVLSQLHKGTI